MAIITVADVLAEGVTDSIADDARIDTVIDYVGPYIERVTGQWFEARDKTYRLDGTGMDVLLLPTEAIELTSITIGDQEIDLDEVEINNAPRNPHLLRTDGGIFARGRRNVVVTGSFGVVELADDVYTAPAQVKRAAVRLVIRDLALLASEEAEDADRRSRVVSETTDGHSYTLAQPSSGGMTGDREVDMILALYRRPSFGGGLGPLE